MRQRSEARQKDFFEKRNKDGRRLNFVISEATYRNQTDTVVARATGTMIMATQVGLETMMEHELAHYSEDDLKSLEETWRREYRRGTDTLCYEDRTLRRSGNLLGQGRCERTRQYKDRNRRKKTGRFCPYER
jgi:hypothetical protein